MVIGTANTPKDGSEVPTFRHKKRRLCPAFFFCDASVRRIPRMVQPAALQ